VIVRVAPTAAIIFESVLTRISPRFSIREMLACLTPIRPASSA